jgi:uncharacterized membrane protein
MAMKVGLWFEWVWILLSLFVVVPLIAVLIGYPARKGKPKNFSRDMYFTAFGTAALASGFLIVYAQRMEVDVRSLQHLLQLMCFGSGVLLLGIAGGCLLGIFMYRRNSSR